MLTSKERQLLEKKAAAKLELERRQLEVMNRENTVFGFVCPKTKKVEFCLQDVAGNKQFVKVDKKPVVTLALKFAKVFEAINDGVPYIALIGGRNSTKSTAMNAILAAFSKDYKEKNLCLREYYNSIEDSSYASIVQEIEEKQYDNFDITNTSITNNKTKSKFIFKGMARNHNSLKSILGVTISFVDEAANISEKSLQFLKKTIIRNKGAIQFYVFNPESSSDPISKEFINRYQSDIDKNGFYRDDRRLVLWLNYNDNPWHGEEAEKERQEDYNNLPRPVYDWIWLGKFLDTVDNPLIQPEWFDAAVDAHKNPKFKKLFEPSGAIISSHDPSDTGEDAKAYAMRHGSVIYNVQEKTDGLLHDGARWAAQLAIADRCTTFTFDASGVGAGIREEIDRKFKGMRIDVDEHKGGSTPDYADDYYEGYNSNDRKNKQKNKDMFINKRAQYMWRLRNRFFNTYKLVVLGEYVNPDDCISLDSETIESMEALRSEICRQPLKNNPNGKIQIMDKQEMKKLGIASPNLLDAVAMTMIYPKANFKEQEDFFNQELPEEIDF